MGKAVTKQEASNIIPLPTEIEQESSNALDLLTEMSEQPKAKSKSKVPVINDPKLKPIVDKVIDLKKQMDDLEAEYGLNSLQLVERARQDYETNRGIVSSYNLAGSKKNVLISFKNQFKKIPIESKGELAKIMGKDYPTFFNDVYEIELLDTSITKIQELIDIIGPAKFKAMFNIKKSYVKVSDMMNIKQLNCRMQPNHMSTNTRGVLRFDEKRQKRPQDHEADNIRNIQLFRYGFSFGFTNRFVIESMKADELYEEVECDEIEEDGVPELDLPYEEPQCCIHGKDVQDYCPHCAEEQSHDMEEYINVA